MRLLLVLTTVSALMMGPATELAGAEGVDHLSTDIQDNFAEPGPWAVSSDSITDDLGNTNTLHYPTALGAHGHQHPVILWGVGCCTGTPEDYTDTLEHLASWGFVVVTSPNNSEDSGGPELAAVQHLVSQNTDEDSIFFGKLGQPLPGLPRGLVEVHARRGRAGPGSVRRQPGRDQRQLRFRRPTAEEPSLTDPAPCAGSRPAGPGTATG